jgi:nucleoside-diphosphate-sugar epimerase
MLKILITGVAGFVGSTLARKLLDGSSNVEVVGIDNLKYGYRERLKDIQSRIKFIEMDVQNLAEELDEAEIDVIIHCAAIAPLPENQANFFESINQNVAMCASLSEFATKIGCENVIFFSSGAIYEGSDNRACCETDVINTSLIYPTSKHLAEQLFSSLAKTYGFKVVAIRLFNLYGPNQDYFRKQPPLLGYLLKCIHSNIVPTIFASKEAKRDYIHIDDLYGLIQKICKKFSAIKPGEFIAVNAGSGSVFSVFNIIDHLGSIVGSEIKYTVGNKKNFWSKYPEIFNKKLALKEEYLVKEVDKIAIANIKFSEEYFDWKPKVKMKDGLRECYEYSKEILK